MANCLEITLWYPEDKFNALSTALEPAGSSVEEELGRVLTELYERLVPSEQRVEIAEKLAREEQHEAEERVRHEAETYRVSVLKLTRRPGPASTISSRGPGPPCPGRLYPGDGAKVAVIPKRRFSFQAGRDGTPFYSRLCRAVDGALSQ